MRVKFNTILCATDLSDYSNQTILYGIALAKMFEARLYVCHVVETIPVVTYGEAFFDATEQQNSLVQLARKQLDNLIDEKVYHFEPIVTVGNKADEILRISEEKSADVVITATRLRHGLKRFLLGSVTDRLMRILTCPLVVLRSSYDTYQEYEKTNFNIKKILVGCDFSSDSDLALNHGLSLAQEFESELHLVHVVAEYPHQYTPDMMMEFNIPHDDTKMQLNKKLLELFPKEAANWCKIKTDILFGQAHEEICNYADSEDIDLIVLGTRGAGLVKTLFIGSTTDRVIRKSECPVLSVCNKNKKPGDT
jgi:nucleotide-binding universal stress UspA family protein